MDHLTEKQRQYWDDSEGALVQFLDWLTDDAHGQIVIGGKPISFGDALNLVKDFLGKIDKPIPRLFSPATEAKP